MNESDRNDLAVIIMAGGSGTRFWPASRENKPKQFLPIFGPKSMFEETYLRIASLSHPDRVFAVVNEHHRPLAERILGSFKIQILSEPYGRNTAPCIGLGCVHILRSFGNIPVIALPADHFMADEEEFRRCVRRGVSLLDRQGFITFGITPTHPETGYGYIEKGDPLRIKGVEAFKVRRFREKPDLKTAESFITSKNYFWNSGIFMFRPEMMLKEIGIHLPAVREGLDRIAQMIHTDLYASTLETAYRDMRSISIDHGIMEKTKEPIYVIPGHFGWSDVGSWAAVKKLREAEHDKDGNWVSGDALLLDTQNALIESQGNRLVALLGLKDILVVDTEDVLLVADLNQFQELRRFPEVLNKKGWMKWV